MKPELAINELSVLKEEASSDQVAQGGEAFTSWQARSRAVLSRALGNGNHTVKSFDDIRYGLIIAHAGTPKSAWVDARRGGLAKARGLIDSAIYELKLLQGNDDPVDERAFDPDLWQYVKDTIETEDWAKVASQVSTFVEDRVRVWTGQPKDRNGDDLYGRGLFTAALADDAEFRLGKRKGEWEGWRMLGSGFAAAIGNVDRHHIQKRDDARRYALGVLGLGSLLLTQLRYEHGDHLGQD